MSALQTAINNLTLKSLQDEAAAELAQLRADLQAAQERIAELEAVIAFSDAEKDRRIAEQARQLDKARNLIIRSGRVINNLKKPDSVYDLTSDLLDWLAANPAPELDALVDHRDKICTCGMGDATMPEYHAKDCPLYRMAAPLVDSNQTVSLADYPLFEDRVP